MNIYNPQPHSAGAYVQLIEERKQIERMQRQNEIKKKSNYKQY